MSFKFSLNQIEYKGSMPASFALRDDIVSCSRDNWRRACCAALGVSCEALELTATYRGASHNPLIFGGLVLDELMNRGIDRIEIINAGMICWTEIAGSLISEEEVKQEEDFLDPEMERLT
jgi:hypothetical protein